jgi:hypothetical protein
VVRELLAKEILEEMVLIVVAEILLVQAVVAVELEPQVVQQVEVQLEQEELDCQFLLVVHLYITLVVEVAAHIMEQAAEVEMVVAVLVAELVQLLHQELLTLAEVAEVADMTLTIVLVQ